MTKEDIVNKWIQNNIAKAKRDALPEKLIQLEKAIQAIETCKCSCHNIDPQKRCLCFVGCCAGAGNTIRSLQQKVINIKDEISSCVI
jgi:hypothetical protein